jgi:hypothetical protein
MRLGRSGAIIKFCSEVLWEGRAKGDEISMLAFRGIGGWLEFP